MADSDHICHRRKMFRKRSSVSLSSPGMIKNSYLRSKRGFLGLKGCAKNLKIFSVPLQHSQNFFFPSSTFAILPNGPIYVVRPNQLA